MLAVVFSICPAHLFSFKVSGPGDTARDEPSSGLHHCCSGIEVSPGDAGGAPKASAGTMVGGDLEHDFYSDLEGDDGSIMDLYGFIVIYSD